jgi:hypothetical protein
MAHRSIAGLEAGVGVTADGGWIEIADSGGRSAAPIVDGLRVISGGAGDIDGAFVDGVAVGRGMSARNVASGGPSRRSLCGSGPIGGSGFVPGNSSGGCGGITLGPGGGPGSGSTGGGNG